MVTNIYHCAPVFLILLLQIHMLTRTPNLHSFSILACSSAPRRRRLKKPTLALFACCSACTYPDTALAAGIDGNRNNQTKKDKVPASAESSTSCSPHPLHPIHGC